MYDFSCRCQMSSNNLWVTPINPLYHVKMLILIIYDPFSSNKIMSLSKFCSDELVLAHTCTQSETNKENIQHPWVL